MTGDLFVAAPAGTEANDIGHSAVSISPQWSILAQGNLRKMAAELATDGSGAVTYSLHLRNQGDTSAAPLLMSPLLGREVKLRFTGAIHCVECGRLTRKSFNQGYCYPCFSRLASCDTCMMDPVTCHYDQGTCREPEWAESVCMNDHFVYLSNTSATKVGITRYSQLPTRWLDQGASWALPIMRTRTRHQAGCVEALLRTCMSDRTAWQRMLKGEPEEVDLKVLRDELFERFATELNGLSQRFGLQSLQPVTDVQTAHIRYPVLRYPDKIKALNLDKTAEISGTLLGIKGQYWLLDTGVINIRKFTAYEVQVAVR